ncbi:MAG: ribose-phosphate pyrophosphokinase [Candidatus Nealsonbacteria bacterium]|nr:ribose-phosphate pyrophosphokinase [Candidatus Nealsonbacteria bacterium]
MELKIFGGQASCQLAEKICGHLGIGVGKSEFVKFSDKEFEVRYSENIRGKEIYIVQSTYAPADNFMELLLWLDAAERAAAGSITAVIPYFGWSRQDRKARSRVPISAKLAANAIALAGAQRILTVDLHSAQLQGFFDLPVDNLYARPVFVDFLKKIFNPDDFVVMGPDVGAAKLAESYAQRLNGRPVALAYKTRLAPNQAKIQRIVGDVQGKNVLIVDDIIDTAGTIIGVTDKLKEMGAKDIYAFCTHGLFSGSAVPNIEKSQLSKVFVTDSVPLKEEAAKSGKIEVISISALLAETIRRAHNNESISSLFE